MCMATFIRTTRLAGEHVLSQSRLSSPRISHSILLREIHRKAVHSAGAQASPPDGANNEIFPFNARLPFL